MKNTSKLILILLAGILLLQGCGTGQPSATATSPVATITKRPTNTPRPTYTPSSTPEPVPGFLAGDKPFRFVGAFIPGWYWSAWSEASDVSLVTESRQAGITVLHVMFPDYEKPRGTFSESELVKLDHFMDAANRNGIYVMGSFAHGYGITYGTEQPFYDPHGVQGLVRRPEYREGFKTHMAAVVNRVNTVNGRKYSEDPTILAWIVIEEIVSAPWNYPDGFPDITALELADWLDEAAAYLKSIDPNHLVTLNTGTAFATFSDFLGQPWQPLFQSPSLDFIELEDAEARILLHTEWMYTINDLYDMRKPIVMMLSYSGGDIDQEKYCLDYQWQADTMKQVADLYLEKGAAGLNIFSWRASTVPPADYDKCYSYDITNLHMAGMLQAISSGLGDLNSPPTPLEFVTLGKWK